MRKVLFYMITIVTFIGCTHEPFEFIGGKTGNAELVIYPQHHGETAGLDSMVVYIKYNTKDAPANSVYDDSTTCTYTNSMPVCRFTGLNNGNYYIYAKGYDYNIVGGVRGGIGYTITSQQVISLRLPVGEEAGF